MKTPFILSALAVSVTAQAQSIDLLQLEKEGKLKALKPVSIQTKDDPAYKTPHEFAGYKLDDILKLIPNFDPVKHSNKVLEFVATDGFKVVAPVATVWKKGGMVAFKVKGAAKGKKWKSFSFGKGEITPGPFYLVWGKSYEDKEYPWPWGLQHIRVNEFKNLYPKATPDNSASQNVKQGFLVFTKHCISCHSINLQGGTAGPEFNTPKSITEYWTKEHFIAFAKNPDSYRARTKMTPKNYIKQSEFSQIWDYLSYIKSKK